METTQKSCAECGNALPSTATKRRKFCSATCRRRSNDRSQRRTNTQTTVQRLTDQLGAARTELARKESQLADARKVIESERTKLRRHEARSRKRERQHQAHAQRAITARVKNLVATRDRLTSVTAELDAATADHVDRSDLETAAQQIVDLETRLATVTDRHRALSGQFEQLRDRYQALVTDYNKAALSLSDLARDRHRFRPVIDAWDTLAGRLANSGPSGQLTPGDREIVRTWALWKSGRDRRLKSGQ